MTQQMRLLSIEPTVFYLRDGDMLRQRVDVVLVNEGEEVDASIRVRTGSIEASWPLGRVGHGERCCPAFIPDARSPTEMTFELWSGHVLQEQRTVSWQPGRHWEVHLIHYSHHDLGYTDLPSNVLAEHAGFMDRVLRFCEETEGWPEADARFRYQCEQAWSLVNYVEHRPVDKIERLVHFIRSGQIELTALFGNQTLELCSTEELVRLLYPAFRLKREHGIEISSAEHNDIPGFPWGLASVLAGAGVRYFSPGVPLWYFEGVHPLWDTEQAIPLEVPAACWWEGPDGARVLLWSDLHGHEWQPYDYAQAVSELPGMLGGLEQRGYPYDMVSYTLRGGHRDNAPPTLRYAYLVRDWNRRWAYPRLINTTNTPFLRAFEARWGDALKTLRGDVPGTDYPVAATCTPKETAVDRVAHEWLASAEKWAAIASIVTGAPYPHAALERAYRNAFYYDLHCWGLSHVGGPAQDAHWSEKATRAYRAAALAHDVMVKAANRIADAVAYHEEGTYLTVFNPLAQPRTAMVRAPGRTWSPCSSPMFWRLPEEDGDRPMLVSGRAAGRRLFDPTAALLDGPFEVIDAETGEHVPYQVSRLADPQAADPWAPERFALGQVDRRHLIEVRLLARDLPPLGYRTYRLTPAAEWPAAVGGATSRVLESGGQLAIENRFYRLKLDRASGAVRSLYDVELGRELIDREAAHSLGQLIVRASDTADEEIPWISEVALAESGPLYTVVRLSGGASCCPRMTVEIALYHAVKRVDVSLRLLRDSTPMRELYVAFPFQIDAPRFRFEAPGSIIEPIVDQWPGSCTDAYGVGHWVEVANEAWGIAWAPLDTPMAELGGLWPGYVSGAHHGVRGPGYGHPFLRAGELQDGYIYALLSYNNFRTNFLNVHPGEFAARYAWTSYAKHGAEDRASHFGWNALNPPQPVWMCGPQEGTLPAYASFCAVDAPNVTVLTLKAAEDGNGYILRLQETGGRATVATVRMPYLSLPHAYETNLVEEDARLLPCTAHSVTVELQPFSLYTVRLGAGA